jgi:arsenite-transporting ATPase
MAETARAAEELNHLGLSQQRLIINGVFKAADAQDQVALSIQQLGEQVIAQMPPILRHLACDSVPLKAFDTLGVMALRTLLGAKTEAASDSGLAQKPLAMDHSVAYLPELDALADQLAQLSHGLIMVMGKGGVGKTTIAAALALGLVARGKRVQLSTTDPAAHLAATLNGEQPGLKLSRIDPQVATQGYIQKIMATEGANLDADAKALLLEDLQSPCTEEVAVFRAFAKLVSEAKQEFVVLDTAPTGHSLLLMDATGAYHRQSLRDMQPTGIASAHMITPLMRLQDPHYTHIILVTLPETTPVSQAAALQEDLRRAGVEPYAWVINKSLLLSGTQDPLLRARMPGELAQIVRIQQGLAQRLFILHWQAQLPLGIGKLQSLVTKKP